MGCVEPAMPLTRLLVLALAIGPVAAADTSGSAGGSGPPGSLAGLLERSDLDHDGRIDGFEANRREVAESRLLRAADADQDGVVDEDEALLVRRTGDLGEQLARYDADRDGRLDIDEFAWIEDGLVRRLLLALDVNRDGVVTAEEAEALVDLPRARG